MQKVLYGVGGLFALLILVGFLLPGESHFEISRPVDAPAAVVHALIETPRQSYLWSRVREIDPEAGIRYSGPRRGKGATMSWKGLVAGSGIEVITGSVPHRTVTKALNPGEPGEAFLHYEVDGAGHTSVVTLRFTHDHGLNIVGRYMGLLISGVLRRDYAAGLDNLARVAESLPDADFSGLDIEWVQVEPVTVAWLATSSAPTAGAVSEALGEAYFRILNALQENGLEASGPPRSVLHEFSGARRLFDAEIPVAGTGDATLANGDGVRLRETPGGPAIRAKHLGSYRGLRNTHRRVAAYLAAYGIETDGDPWESYASDPAVTAEENLLTYVYYPVSDAAAQADADLTRKGAAGVVGSASSSVPFASP